LWTDLPPWTVEGTYLLDPSFLVCKNLMMWWMWQRNACIIEKSG
jgi:hypothetical protein